MSVFILGNVFFFTMTAKTLCRTRHKDDTSLFYSKQTLMQLNKLLEGVIHKFHFSGFVPSLFFSCLWESHGWLRWFLLRLVDLPISGFQPISSTFFRQFSCSSSSFANPMFGHFSWKNLPACKSLTASVRRAWKTIKRMKMNSKQLFKCVIILWTNTSNNISNKKLFDEFNIF